MTGHRASLYWWGNGARERVSDIAHAYSSFFTGIEVAVLAVLACAALGVIALAVTRRRLAPALSRMAVVSDPRGLVAPAGPAVPPARKLRRAARLLLFGRRS